MKRHLFCALFACCVTLLAARPALAELQLTLVNRTHFEIQYILMKGDGASFGSTIRVVPGNSCTFTDGNSSELKELVIDAGLILFTFTDTGALAGNSSPTLELSFDADGRPHLTLVDKARTLEGEGFDVEAGPIWNNDHAKERCPEVLQEWLAANPGKKAEWTGNWVTTVEGAMSVCGIRLIKDQADAVAPAIPSLVTVVGTASVFADPSQAAATDFAEVLKAESMGAIRAMGGRTSPLSESTVFLPASFAGKTWAAFVEPAESFSTDEKARPGDCMLRTYTGEDGLLPLVRELASMGYRPWFAQRTAGEDMDTQGMVKVWEEEPDFEQAWRQVMEGAIDANEGDGPAAVDIILLSEEDYGRAAGGNEGPMPGYRLRVSNSVVITLRYMPDASPLIGMTR